MKLLAHAGFASSKPYFETVTGDVYERHHIKPGTLSLSFDTAVRYCIGWHDLQSKQNHPCPDQSRIDKAYSQCAGCQRRTGFNPAFYHATSVSQQQTKRNQEPHILYLAYFAPNTLKVGISHAERGLSRLQEQGARAALVLDTFATALIARQYEAAIAKDQTIYEHVTQRKKRELFTHDYSPARAEELLRKAATRLENELSASFADQSFYDFNDAYFFSQNLNISEITFVDTYEIISGDIRACIGTELIAEHSERLVALNVKSFVGYQVKVGTSLLELELEPMQSSLF